MKLIIIKYPGKKYSIAHPASGDKLLGEKAIAHNATSIEPRDTAPHAADM